MRTVLDARGKAVALVAAVAGVLRVVPRRVEGVGERHEAPRQEFLVTDLNGERNEKVRKPIFWLEQVGKPNNRNCTSWGLIGGE